MKSFQISIFLILFSINLASAQKFDIDTIHYAGTNEKRINLVVLPDGYQSFELGKFIEDSKKFTNAFFNESPFKEYKNYFNVYAIKVPSNQSGAKHPGNASDVTEPVHPIEVVDNYFGSTFDAYNIHRLLVPMNNVAISNVLADNFPIYDQVVVLVNTPYYGGSGGIYATGSTESSSNEVMLHEIGHSFSTLADEYYAGDQYVVERVNMTQQNDSTKVKWKNWIGIKGTGIFQHCCGGKSSSWYKPHTSCKMQLLGKEFCPVCTEGIIEKIHSITSPIDTYSPISLSVQENSYPINFNVELIKTLPNSLSISWSLNGTTIETQKETISILEETLNSDINKLTLTVIDTNHRVKTDNHSIIHFNKVSWEIDKKTLTITKVKENEISLAIFPNPSENFLQIELSSKLPQPFSIIILSSEGKEIIKQKSKQLENSMQIDLHHLSAGSYIVQFKLDDGTIYSENFTKQ